MARKDEIKVTERTPLLWSRIRTKNQNAFSEFFGTFIFLLFSFGVTAQVVLSDSKNGDYTTLCLGWGVGIMLGAYTAAPSGGHLNPAVTLSMCIYRRFPWRQFPIYALSQTLGAFCAAGVVFANYKSAIAVYEGGPNIHTVTGFTNHSTSGIFATSPAPFMSTTGAFFSEFLASAVLMFCIFALTAEKYGSKNLTPLMLAFVFIGISACFGWETGFAINGARDFGPRLLVYFLGYGSKVWSASNYYFWIPIVAPFLGCAFGGFLYDTFLHEDESPINSPHMGLARLWRPDRQPATSSV
ncbi:putative aquaglyceroporin [Tothia fuscella]|uniref:Aquaglyceroporin n=1 Tax=Tothia fuscella TaxID=1048955 RepID=A0A9P4NT69_9PEZI|nr:putative aquaglyceroporin [Tothia fuscella]